MKHYVYGLYSNETKDIFYIGASKDPNKRLYGHITGRAQQKTLVQKRLFERHDDVSVVILSECENRQDALDKERHLIKYYSENGHPILNKVHTSAYADERAEIYRKRKIFNNTPEQIEKRRGKKFIQHIEFLRWWNPISMKQISIRCGFDYRQRRDSNYITKDEYKSVIAILSRK